MAVQPDILYLRSREDLLAYEDARANSLFSGMPNCYAPLTDYAVWGAFTRALAQELARIEYMYSYDLVALNPQYLTPPDIKRRFAAPLYINSSYPNASQSDQAYKAMLAALIPAYQQGTTLAAIQAVVEAYTGQAIEVQELYRLIDNETVFDYQRNILRLSVPSVLANPLSAIQAAGWMQTISQDLYTAIDLAKPAHIGLDYSVLFGDTENFGAIVTGVTDVFAPMFVGVEASPLPSIFTEAPYLDEGSPDTPLAAFGKLASLYFAHDISAAQYATLQSTAFQAEYAENPDGSYSLSPSCYNDVVIEDSTGSVTGAISKAQGVLAPQLVTSWEIAGDAVVLFELD